MFCENLKTLRKAKGLSQEELAERLHVVRQTISKWEQGLSVPDAALLVRMAEVLETTVGTLLGERVDAPEEENAVAQKLEQLNLLLMERSRRSRRIWKTVAGILIGLAALTILLIAVSAVAFQSFQKPGVSVSQIEEFVEGTSFSP